MTAFHVNYFHAVVHITALQQKGKQTPLNPFMDLIKQCTEGYMNADPTVHKFQACIPLLQNLE